MWLLFFGLALFSGIHLIPSLLANLREILVNKIGTGPFKGLFSIVSVLAVMSIVFGWQSIEPVHVYTPAPWSTHVTYFLVLLTFVLFVTPYIKTNIRRIFRHPQLLGVIIWSIGHLLSNGDNRSLVLFTWFALWAILEMYVINRREGEWIKPPQVPVKYDVLAAVSGCIVYFVFLLAHPYITGMRLISL